MCINIVCPCPLQLLRDCFSCSCQPHWAASYLPLILSHPLLCLGLHSCNQSKRGHSQQRNMLKNKQHDAGICCRNAAAVAVIAAAAATAAAVGQSTTAIRNQSKCQRAKQTSRTHTHTHAHMQIAVCVCARTPYIKPCSKDFQFIFTKTFFCCRLRFVPPSFSLALSLWFPSRCYCFCNGQRK